MPGTPKVDLTKNLPPGADPRMQLPTAKEDPRLLLRQGRELYHQNKLDDADKLCTALPASPVLTGGCSRIRRISWLTTFSRTRAHQGHEESFKLTAKARQLFNEGKLQEAKVKAYPLASCTAPWHPLPG